MISLRSRRTQDETVTLVDRMRWSRGRSRYWLIVAVLATVGAGLLLLAPPRPAGITLPEPAGTGPEVRVLDTRQQPLGGVERLSVRALVAPGLTDSVLRVALDRVLYGVLDEANGKRKRRVRVVWAYLVESETARPMQWRAMAIWTDTTLARSLRPAGNGGDAVRERGVEYDFTNPVSTGAGTGPAGK